MRCCVVSHCTGADAQQTGNTDSFSATPELLAGSSSADDGAAYLASVKAAQQELDAAGSVAPCSTPTAAAWPGPSMGCSKLEAMKAATQAALAAAGLPGQAARDRSTAGGPAPQAVHASDDTPSTAALEAAEEPGTQDSQPRPAAQGEAGAARVAGVRGFDLGLVHSWSSAATDPASDGDGSGSSPPAVSRADSTKASGGTSPVAPMTASERCGKAEPQAAAPEDAAPEDVVLQVPACHSSEVSAGAGSNAATGLYDLD